MRIHSLAAMVTLLSRLMRQLIRDYEQTAFASSGSLSFALHLQTAQPQRRTRNQMLPFSRRLGELSLVEHGMPSSQPWRPWSRRFRRPPRNPSSCSTEPAALPPRFNDCLLGGVARIALQGTGDHGFTCQGLRQRTGLRYVNATLAACCAQRLATPVSGSRAAANQFTTDSAVSGPTLSMAVKSRPWRFQWRQRTHSGGNQTRWEARVVEWTMPPARHKS